MRRLNTTQRAWVASQLLAGRALSPPDLIEAFNGRGGWRPGAGGHKLRGDGWPIESRPMPNPGPDTDLNPPVVYRLPPGWRPGVPAQLRLPL